MIGTRAVAPAVVAAMLLSACSLAGARGAAVSLPDPKIDVTPGTPGDRVAVFAGGCFWGIEAVFEHVAGVKRATSGYAGGNADTAHYWVVGTGRTGHAEAVKVVYDPARVSYGQLLEVFFSVAHDPTQLDRQSPDVGPQYRSELFTTSAAQAKVAKAYIAQLDAAKLFPRPIVTRVEPLQGFYDAEEYHQDYLRLHPRDAYIVRNDAPKLVALQAQFPRLYRQAAAD